MLTVLFVSVIFIGLLALNVLVLSLLFSSAKQNIALETQVLELKRGQEERVASKAKELAVQMVNENEVPDDEKSKKSREGNLLSVSELEQNPVLFERFARNFRGWNEETNS